MYNKIIQIIAYWLSAKNYCDQNHVQLQASSSLQVTIAYDYSIWHLYFHVIFRPFLSCSQGHYVHLRQSRKVRAI